MYFHYYHDKKTNRTAALNRYIMIIRGDNNIVNIFSYLLNGSEDISLFFEREDILLTLTAISARANAQHQLQIFTNGHSIYQ